MQKKSSLLQVKEPYSNLVIYIMHIAYFSLLEFCCTVWSPHTQEYINKLEMVQQRVARYVAMRCHNTSSVTSMLDHLEWESLEARRDTKFQLTMLFKIINDMVDIPQEEYLTPASKRTPTGDSHKFRQIPASSDYYLNSFFPKTVRLWSLLTSHSDLTFPVWYSSNGSLALYHSKNLSRAGQCSRF